MKEFAELLHHLILAQSRNRKIEILTNYFKETPDPERGYVLAILTGNLSFPLIKATQLKKLILQRVDPVLFAYSYDYVGDLAETIALLWPSSVGVNPESLETLIQILQTSEREEAMEHIVKWLNVITATERWALVKLITGGLRIGLSERLTKLALAQLSSQVTVEEIEESWHGLTPPYIDLFSWLDKGAEKPTLTHNLNFRSFMLSSPIEEAELPYITPQDYSIEWKWDGIRVQLVGDGEKCRMYSRSGEDISNVFPDIIENIQLDAVVDGELLVKHPGGIATFNDLQQRLNRKKPTTKIQEEFPAFIRLYDLLIDGIHDLRPLPFKQRRKNLENWILANPSNLWDLSTLVPFADINDLKDTHQGIRVNSEQQPTEGFMIKRLDSPYVAGRVKGLWYKWKRDPLSVDVVMMYAQRGHGKRSSYYSNYTFGAWTTDKDGHLMLVPVAKAYSGFSDKELVKIDKWVRKNIIKKFGPVSEVTPELVFEIEFDSVHHSNRHKSEIAVRFPRIRRIRWDKPAAEADTVESLKKLI